MLARCLLQILDSHAPLAAAQRSQLNQKRNALLVTQI